MNHELWDEYRGKIKSKKGGWRIGDKVLSHGFNLLEELVGEYSYMQIVILNAVGRMPGKDFAEWMEAFFICLSWPDPRIWCNRVGALGGSAGVSPVAATCAGLLAADSSLYGIKPVLAGSEFIQELKRRVDAGETIEEILASELEKRGGKPHFTGFIRPVTKIDERIPVLQRISKKLNFEEGPHLKLAYQMEQILGENFDTAMNIGGYVAAFISDQNYSPTEYYRICSAVLYSGVTAAYADANDREPGTFAPLQVQDFEYKGKGPRSLE